MTSLAEIRAALPQYADMPDDQFVKALHQNGYGNVPFDAFAKAIGYQPPRGILAETGASLARGGGNLAQILSATAGERGMVAPETAAKGVAFGERVQRDYPPSEDVAKGLAAIMDSPDGWSAVYNVITNPAAVAQMGAESLAASAPSIVGGIAGVPGGPAGIAAGVGSGSFLVEYGSAVNEAMRKNGVNLADEKQVAAAFLDPKIMAEARDRGVKGGISVGLWDAASGAFAGTLVRGARGAASFAKRASVELGIQGAAGAAGDATKQVATDGKITSPGSVAADFAAELFPGGIPEIATGAYARRKSPMAAATEPPAPAPQLPEQMLPWGEAPALPEQMRPFGTPFAEPQPFQLPADSVPPETEWKPWPGAQEPPAVPEVLPAPEPLTEWTPWQSAEPQPSPMAAAMAQRPSEPVAGALPLRSGNLDQVSRAMGRRPVSPMAAAMSGQPVPSPMGFPMPAPAPVPQRVTPIVQTVIPEPAQGPLAAALAQNEQIVQAHQLGQQIAQQEIDTGARIAEQHAEFVQPQIEFVQPETAAAGKAPAISRTRPQATTPTASGAAALSVVSPTVAEQGLSLTEQTGALTEQPVAANEPPVREAQATPALPEIPARNPALPDSISGTGETTLTASPTEIVSRLPETTAAISGSSPSVKNRSRADNISPLPSRPSRPLADFLASTGGINVTDRRETSMEGQWLIPKAGPLWRKAAKGLDYARERAVEAGYLRSDATVEDLVRALDRDRAAWSTKNKEQRVYPGGDTVEDTGKRQDEEQARLDMLLEEVRAHSARNGYELTEREMRSIAETMLTENMDASDATDRFIENDMDDAKAEITDADDEGPPLDFEAPGGTRPEPSAGTTPESGTGGQERAADAVTEEPGAEGRPQLVLPGMERSAKQAKAARDAAGPRKGQKPADEELFAPREKEQPALPIASRDYVAELDSLKPALTKPARLAEFEDAWPKLVKAVRNAQDLLQGSADERQLNKAEERLANRETAVNAFYNGNGYKPGSELKETPEMRRVTAFINALGDELDAAAEAKPSVQYAVARKKPADAPDLIVQHNLSAANLLHAARMGGIPVPSLAITKSDTPLTGFGEITLLGQKELADPKGYAGTKVFGADIYSPRYPKVEHVFKAKDWSALTKEYAAAEKLFSDGLDEDKAQNNGLRYFEESPLTKAKFLLEKGIQPELESYSPGSVSLWGSDKKMRDQIDAAGLTEEFDAYPQQMFAKLNAVDRIFKGFSYSGNRQYKPHTIDNVIAILKKELRGGEGFNYGVGSLRSQYTQQFRSVKQIKDNKALLTDKDTFGKIKNEIDAEFFGVAELLKPYSNRGKDFGFADTVINVFSDVPKMGLKRALKEYGFEDVGQEALEKSAAFLGKLRNLPTEYFEAKVLRAVDVSEFKVAVVPDNLRPAARDVLTKRGVEIVEYKAGDEADRKRVIAEAARARQDDVMFAVSRPTTAFARDRSAIVAEATKLAKRINPAVRVEAVDGIFDVDGAAFARSGGGQGMQVVGSFDPSRSLIRVALDADVLPVVAHEAFHSIEKLIPERDMRLLRAAFPASGGRAQNEEIAYAFQDHVSGKPRGSLTVRGIFGRVREFIKNLGNLLLGRGFRSVESVFEDAIAGKFAPKMQAVDVKGTKVWGIPLGKGGYAIKAYHGSPHRFDKFSMDKIGTGEGAQAYGYGLYFAENPEVAGGYKKRLAATATLAVSPKPSKLVMVNGVDLNSIAIDAGVDALGKIKVMQALKKHGGDVVKTLSDLREQARRQPNDNEKAKKFWDKTMDFANSLSGKTISFVDPPPPIEGALYTTTLDVEPEDLLDWDKPLSEQSAKVREALALPVDETGRVKLPNGERVKPNELRGDSLYRAFVEGHRGFHDRATTALRAAGIPGIRYLDAGSRTTGDGSRNIVMFDDSLIRIDDVQYAVRRRGKISETQSAFLRGYKEDDYRWVNKYLQDGKLGSDKDRDVYIRKLDAAIAKGEIDRDTTVYRGMRWPESFGPPKDSVGKVISLPSYTSVSTDPNMAASFAGLGNNGVRLVIDVPAGTRGVETADYETTNNANESEILLPRDGMLAIDRVEQAGRQKVIYGRWMSDDIQYAVAPALIRPDWIAHSDPDNAYDRIRGATTGGLYAKARDWWLSEGITQLVDKFQPILQLGRRISPNDPGHLHRLVEFAANDAGAIQATMEAGAPDYDATGMVMKLAEGSEGLAPIMTRHLEGAPNSEARQRDAYRAAAYRIANRSKRLKAEDARTKLVVADMLSEAGRLEAQLKRDGPSDSALELKEEQKIRAAIKDLRDRAKEMDAGSNREKLLTDADIAKALDVTPAERERYDAMWQDYDRHNRQVLDFAVKTGVVKAGAAKEWSSYGDYVPFYRVMEEDGELIGPREYYAGINNPDPKIKKLKGGTSKLGDPYENIARNERAIIAAGRRNIALREIASALIEAGEGRYVPMSGDTKNTILLYENGEKKRLQVDDPTVAASLMALGPQRTNGILRLLQTFAQVYRAGITLTPTFAIANMLRDIPSAYIQTGASFTAKTNALTKLADAYKGSTNLSELRAITGFGGTQYSSEGSLFQPSLAEEVGTKRTGGFKTWARNTHNALEKLSQATEWSGRLAIYENLIAKGVPKERAAYEAMNVINFGRSGANDTIRMLTQLVPFLNARIQGLSRMFETQGANFGTAERKKLMTQLFMRGAILSAATAAIFAGYSDEDWDKYDEESIATRAGYHIIYTGAPKPLFIPKAFEWGTLFSTLPETLIRAINGNHDGELAKMIKHTLVNTFAFNPIPQAILPALETYVNYDMFQDRDLEPQYLSRFLPEERAMPTTSVTAQGLARMLPGNLSPIQVQHLVEGYGGAAAQALLFAFDGAAGAAGLAPEKPTGAFGDSIPGKLLETVLGRFVRDRDIAPAEVSLQKLYDIKKRADQTYATAVELQRRGESERARQLMEENKVPLMFRKQLGKATDDLATYTKMARQIRYNSTMSAQEKKIRIDELTNQKNAIARRYMALVNKAAA